MNINLNDTEVSKILDMCEEMMEMCDSESEKKVYEDLYKKLCE